MVQLQCREATRATEAFGKGKVRENESWSLVGNAIQEACCFRPSGRLGFAIA